MKKSLVVGVVLAAVCLVPGLSSASLKNVNDRTAVAREVSSAMDRGAGVAQVMGDLMANPNGQKLAPDAVAAMFSQASARQLSTTGIVAGALNAGVSPASILAGAGANPQTQQSAMTSMFSVGVPESDIDAAAGRNKIPANVVAAARNDCNTCGGNSGSGQHASNHHVGGRPGGWGHDLPPVQNCSRNRPPKPPRPPGLR